MIADRPAAARSPRIRSARSTSTSWPELVAPALIVVCLLVEAAMLWVGVDDMDEGYFAEQAWRVLNGQVPYRDFDVLYTPGLLYEHAGIFAVFGTHVFGLRVLSFVTRVALVLGLYLLARPLARPFWAALPSLYLLIGLDRAPLNWEPHPGWQSAFLTLVGVGLFATLPAVASGMRWRRLLLMGVVVALTFVHKQNAGVFLGLAAALFLLLQRIPDQEQVVGALAGEPSRNGASPVPRDPPDAPAADRRGRALRRLALTVVVGGLTWLIAKHPFADPFLFVYLLAPLAMVGWISASEPRRAGWLLGTVRGWLALAGGFVVATAPWLIALVLVMGGQFERLSGFVGGTDIAALAVPLDLPGTSAWTAVLGLGVTSFALLRSTRPLSRLMLIVLMAGFGLAAVLLSREGGELLWDAALRAPQRAAVGLQAYVPFVALLGGVWLTRKPVRDALDWRLRWYVFAGGFTFLVQFPRLDDFHLIWSAGLPLIVGAIGLDRLYSHLGYRWRLSSGARFGLASALLLVPLLTALPTLHLRGSAFVKADRTTGLPVVTPLVRLEGLPSLDGVLARADTGEDLAELNAEVRARTAPGEPIFVYPSSPLLYLVTERPNPTRFAHLYPGAASREDLDGVTDDLRNSNVRLAIVSMDAFLFWGPPRMNQPLEDFLAQNFHDVAQVGGYRILARNE